MRRDEATVTHSRFLFEVHECEPALTREEAEAFSKAVYCPPGKVLLACHKPRTKIGLLHLPDDVAEAFRADMATVVAFGEGVNGLAPGDTVVTDWELAKRVQGLEALGVRIEGEIRMFGCAGGTDIDDDTGCAALPFHLQPWTEGIPLKMTDSGLAATGQNVFFKMPPMEEATESGIYVSELSRRRDSLWEIVSVGPDVPEEDRDRMLGKYACVHSGDMRKVVTDDGIEYAVGHYQDPVYFIVERSG